MIRADSLKKLTEKAVLEALGETMEAAGFKYLKSKQTFKRTVGNFEHTLGFGTPHSPLQFDEDKDELSLKIQLYTALLSPKFDKWVEKTLEENSRFRHQFQSKAYVQVLNPDQLTKEDFFTPTESQKFKQLVSASLAGPDTSERSPLGQVKEEIPPLLEALTAVSQAEALFERRQEDYYPYLQLLVFEGKTELAQTRYLEVFEEVKAETAELLKTNPKEATDLIVELEDLANEIKTLFGLEVEATFQRELATKPLQGQKVRLAPEVGYVEQLRLDVSMVKVNSFAINDAGECLLLREAGMLTKVATDGAVQEIGKLQFPSQFRKDSYTFKVQWLEEAQCFACNNFVVNESNELIELTLDLADKKFKPDSVYTAITDFAFDPAPEQFHLLFSPDHKVSYHAVYDRTGTLVKNQPLDRKGLKINLPRKELLVQGNGNSVDVLSFDGEVLGNYPYGKGNHRIALSPDGNLMALHFYATKSQLYDLEKGKKNTLWAHPTFLKDYKNTFYHDIHHNFGMTYAEFSPDGRYLVGGADHGKYVCWDTQKWERRELIPSEAARSIFQWSTTTFQEGGSTKNYFTPYTAMLEEQEHFINRGYKLTEISYLSEGTLWVLQVKDNLLVWNTDGQNVGYVYGIGYVAFSTSHYLAVLQGNDLVIMQRQEGSTVDFESSTFKEKEEVDSGIRYWSADTQQDPHEEIETQVAPAPSSAPTKEAGNEQMAPVEVQKAEEASPRKKGLLGKLF
ncbi:MAG: hypothetical protein AAFQ98_15780 [Bacteroidota bacterium]